jgi:hypothetical protein
MGEVLLIGERRNTCTMLVGMSEGIKPLVRPGSRWENNPKMDLRERWRELDLAGSVMAADGGLLLIWQQTFSFSKTLEFAVCMTDCQLLKKNRAPLN